MTTIKTKTKQKTKFMYPIRTAPLTFQMAATEVALNILIESSDRIYAAEEAGETIDDAAERQKCLDTIKAPLAALVAKHEIDLGDVSLDDTCMMLCKRVVSSLHKLLELLGDWDLAKMLARANLNGHITNLNVQRDSDGQIIPDPSIVQPEEPAKA